ncbi:MAG: peptidoglycan-associated lipoprotein Pal [Nitrospira sp.]|nr:peptidoglycan-associated lipoprotein Pal [Nitrospira sp.]
MRTMPKILPIALIATALLVGPAGCAKKGVQSAGDQTAQQSAGKSATAGSGSGSSSSMKSGVGSFPDTSMQSGSGGLKGLDKNPAEERLAGGLGGSPDGGPGGGPGGGSGGGAGGGPVGGAVGSPRSGSGSGPGGGPSGSSGASAGSGTLLAKADPSESAGRQLDEIRAEQAASAAAGLRDVFFGYDSWTISEEGRQSLGRDAEWMKSNPSAMIKVEGHCDERGTAAYNLVLGEKRAKAVRNYLVELGIGANRLSVVSYGKERPFCNDHAESCYQQNRRGHLVVRTGK